MKLSTSVSSIRMVTVDFMLSLSTKTYTSFGITLMQQKIKSGADNIKMLKYLIDNIFVEVGGRIFQQTIGIPMGINCAPLLADLFLYSYEAGFVKKMR